MLHAALLRPSGAALAGLLVAAACAGGSGTGDDPAEGAGDAGPTTVPTTGTTATSRADERDTTTTTEPDPFARPDWLGTRPLPLRSDGLGEPQPTPPELTDRTLRTPSDMSSELPPPPDDAFHSRITAVPDDVAARSTWHPVCPVDLDDLRYVTVSVWGFDGDHHTGELLIHASAAEAIVAVFARLHEARFPIEELRITRAEEVDAHPTGDGNVSGGFVCRPAVQSDSWSQHAYGLAVDINPFHNPYMRGDAVVPELASAYLDRDNVRPGMITAGDVVTQAFADIGWAWGGDWRTAKDWMHFSASGR
jgi:hypothetical protein